jgi:hypothetical protein
VLVRELADWNPDDYERVTCWPLREALLSLEQRLKQRARDDFRWESLIHAVIAPHVKNARDRKPPEPPEILKD